MRVSNAKARAEAVSKRGHEWAERQHPDSAAGVAISAWRSYRSVEGPLQSALLSVYGLLLLLLVQLTELRGAPGWVGLVLALGWVGLLVLFFVWVPWLLTHKLIARRDLLPSAALTALGLVVLMLVSAHVMQFWVDLYARDYGGLGVVLAIYFWLPFSSAIIAWAASLSPALADRRNLRRAA